MATSDLAAYERVEIQMSMLVPLLRDLQAILGDDVVLDALAERHRRRIDAATYTVAELLRNGTTTFMDFGAQLPMQEALLAESERLGMCSSSG